MLIKRGIAFWHCVSEEIRLRYFFGNWFLVTTFIKLRVIFANCPKLPIKTVTRRVRYFKPRFAGDALEDHPSAWLRDLSLNSNPQRSEPLKLFCPSRLQKHVCTGKTLQQCCSPRLGRCFCKSPKWTRGSYPLLQNKQTTPRAPRNQTPYVLIVIARSRTCLRFISAFSRCSTLISDAQRGRRGSHSCLKADLQNHNHTLKLQQRTHHAPHIKSQFYAPVFTIALLMICINIAH